MKALEAIKRADNLRPNALADEVKAKWVAELDAMLADFMDKPMPQNMFPDDWELLMPFPYDSIYEQFLCAKIDHALQETSDYADDIEMFNATYEAAKSWVARTHMPIKKRESGWITL